MAKKSPDDLAAFMTERLRTPDGMRQVTELLPEELAELVNEAERRGLLPSLEEFAADTELGDGAESPVIEDDDTPMVATPEALEASRGYLDEMEKRALAERERK